MTRSIVLVAVLACSAAAAHAQADSSIRREPRLGPGLERLDLSQEQRQQMRALMQEHRAAEEARRTEFREKMRALLTDEQRQRLDAMRELRMQRNQIRREVRREMSRREFMRREFRRQSFRNERFRDRGRSRWFDPGI